MSNVMLDVWQWIGRSGVGASLATYVAAVASAIAIIITATRKRRDMDVTEMQRRILDLAERVEHLEYALDTTRDELIAAEHDRFVLRRTLAALGIADPTSEAS